MNLYIEAGGQSAGFDELNASLGRTQRHRLKPFQRDLLFTFSVDPSNENFPSTFERIFCRLSLSRLSLDRHR